MKLLAWCPQPLDGTAYWRVASPLSRLRQQAPNDFSFTIVASADTNDLLAHDVLLLQRPFLDDHLAAASIARSLGRKIWCDWDDDILDVPPNNGRVFVYQAEKHKSNVVELARIADVVTVTCEHLAQRFKDQVPIEHHGKIMIVPNALDPTLTLTDTNTDRLPVRQIAWRGGDSHNEDLSVMGDAFPKIAQETEGRALWHFIGMNPYWLLPKFPAESVFVHHWIGDVIGYLRFISRLRPAILAVPLCDTKFNRSKSNIAVIEAAWLGALPVVPRWLEGCDLPGAVTYEDDKDFERALREAVLMPRAELVRRAADVAAAVVGMYSLDNVNVLRALALKRITGETTDAPAPASREKTAIVGLSTGSAAPPQ